MKPHSMFAPFLLVFAILITASALHAGAPKSPTSMWKPPDGKTIEIERFSREGPNEVVVERYKLGVLVPGKDTVGGVDCWKLTFLPGQDTPARLAHYYSIAVAKDASWSLKIVHIRALKRVPEPALTASVIGFGHPLNSLGIIGASPSLKAGIIKPTEQADWLERFGKASFITAAPEGFPVEIFPLYEPGQFSSAKSGAMLTLRSQKKGEYLVVEAEIKGGDQEKLLIRQKWIEGEKWWREYERYVDGRKDLQARQVMPPPVKVLPPVDAMRADPKLRVVVEVEEKGAKLPVLFDRIHKATGVLLTVDPSLADHVPNLGSIQPSKNGWRASDVMSIIERSELENGRWVKTKSGYKLTGVSKVPLPVILPEDGVAPETRGTPPRRFPWGWATLGVALPLLAAAALVIYRRRVKKAAATARKQKSAGTSPKPKPV